MGNCFQEELTYAQASEVIMFYSYTLPQMKILKLKQMPPLPSNISALMNQLGPFEIRIPNSTYLLQDKSVYQGNFNETFCHGPAQLLLADGTLIQSEFFVNGIPTKNTRVFKRNGDYFSGYIHEETGLVTGKVYEKGILYEGGLFDKKPYGKGVESSKNFRFEGTFHNGVKTEGRLEWHLENPKIRQCYEGTFQKNTFHGAGTLTNHEGKYVGNFEEGAKSGYGELFYTNGKVYKGHFRNNQPNGEGKLFDIAGNVEEEGTWINGKKLISQ